MPESVPSIADQLRDAIERSQMTHYALGKLSGVTPEQIDRFMRQERDLRLETAAKLARALGMRLTKQASDGRRKPDR